MPSSFFESVLSLIVRTSTDLPPDVRAAMKVAMNHEEPGTQSSQALTIIAQNIDQAADGEGAICQDTGMPTFEVKTPVGANQIVMKKEIREAVAEATRRGKLRSNSVDSITGENTGDNLGPGTPIIHFEQWDNADEIEVKLILKGGGCENMNAQYSVPVELPNLGRADRNLEGVRKCILHAVWNAQGKGCAPGAVGVCSTTSRPVRWKPAWSAIATTGCAASRYSQLSIAPLFASRTTPSRRNAQQSYATDTKKLAGSRFIAAILQPISETRPPNPIVPIPRLFTSPMIDASSSASRGSGFTSSSVRKSCSLACA